MKEFLSYWKPDQVKKGLRLRELPHAVSNQYKRITPGNRVWICGFTRYSVALHIIGYIDVWHRVNQETAQAILDERYDDYDAWDADWHVISRQGEECGAKAVSLSRV